MSIFLFPNSPMLYCYYFVPESCYASSQKQPSLQLETPTTSGAEILNQNVSQSQKICLTKEDLETKGYEQNKKPWTENQDKLLLRLCEDQNARFQEIAQLIPGRNAKMCYSRYRRLMNQVKQAWTEQENNKLRTLAEEYSENWKLIATFFKKRNDKQLKDHYLNYLRPNLNKGQWSVQEDMRLIWLINTYGKNWKLIQESMPDRSRNQIKNRYFGRIKRIDEQKKKRQENTTI